MKPENRLHKTEKTLTNEEKAFQMRAKGFSQSRIAEELEMTQQGVSKALKRATERFAKAYLEDVKHIKDEQVMQLEYVASEAMEAWHESKKIRKSTRTKDKDSKKAQGEKTTEQAMFGDPRYLAEFRKAKADIREILGVKYIETEDDDLPLGEIRINIIKPEHIPDDDDSDD